MRHILILSFTALQFAFALPKEMEVPQAVKQQYAPLYKLPVEQLSDGSLKFHNARLFNRGGINILSLKGDRFEMAFQHGKLLKEEILKGPLPPTSTMLERVLKTSLPNLPVLTEWFIKKQYENYPDQMIYKMRDDHPQIFKDLSNDAWGLAEASGLTVAQVTYAMLMPESIMVMFGKLVENPFPVSTLPHSSACSAFAAWGNKTPHGSLIIGRNTDYGLNGFYDKFPTAIYFTPTNGEQKYMSMGSAGIHNAGVLGYNESGIYLGLHLIPTLDVDAHSLPAIAFGQEVLRKAHSFDEALQILTSVRPGSGWIYMLASTKENKVASIEFTHKHMAVRPSEGNFHVQTNHYLTPQLHSQFLAVNQAVQEDTEARYARIQELLSSASLVDKEKASSILADKKDRLHGVIRGVGNTVSVHTTMTSAVFDAFSGKIFMANGTAPVSQNDYIELPLPQNFNDSTFAKDEVESIPAKAYAIQHPNKAAAEQKFILAKIAYEIELDNVKAEKYMTETVKIDDSNPHYFFALSVFQMKNGHIDQALASLKKVAEMYDVHLSRVAHYYLGRIYASRFQKALALDHLQPVLSYSSADTEKSLLEAAKKSREHVKSVGFQVFQPQKISYLMQEGDCVGYQ